MTQKHILIICMKNILITNKGYRKMKTIKERIIFWLKVIKLFLINKVKEIISGMLKLFAWTVIILLIIICFTGFLFILGLILHIVNMSIISIELCTTLGYTDTIGYCIANGVAILISAMIVYLIIIFLPVFYDWMIDNWKRAIKQAKEEVK